MKNWAFLWSLTLLDKKSFRIICHRNKIHLECIHPSGITCGILFCFQKGNNVHCKAFNMDDHNQRSRKNYPFWFIITSTSSNHEQLGTITASHWMDRFGLREFSDILNILPVTKKSQRTYFISVPPKNLMTTLWLYGSTKTVFRNNI